MVAHDGFHLVAALIGGGLMLYSTIAVFRGRLYDADIGPIDQATRPVAFWLSVLGMMLLGLFILGIGWQWPVIGAVFRFIDG